MRHRHTLLGPYWGALIFDQGALFFVNEATPHIRIRRPDALMPFAPDGLQSTSAMEPSRTSLLPGMPSKMYIFILDNKLAGIICHT